MKRFLTNKMIVVIICISFAIILICVFRVIFAPVLNVDKEIDKIVINDYRGDGYPKYTVISDGEIIGEIVYSLNELELKQGKKIPEATGGMYVTADFYSGDDLIVGIDIHPDFINYKWHRYARKGSEDEINNFLKHIIEFSNKSYNSENDIYQKIKNGVDPIS
ncbi:MAG: hypothetical protein K5848_05245 [Lachnospiraceae bacterium]|nr:hypothetical protein [Lachnospiraceae bacterium]